MVQGEHVDNGFLPSYLLGEGGVKISAEIVLEAMRVYRAEGLV
ncbi:MAG: hypothetical protein ACRDRN_24520 [Sciscionella sp.]